MKTQQFYWTKETNWNLPEAPLQDAQVLFIFAGIDVIETNLAHDELKSHFPKADQIYMSTSGEIMGNEIKDDSLVVTAVHFEKTPIQIQAFEKELNESGFDLGVRIAQGMDAADLKHLLIFSEGHDTNGDHLIEGLRSKIDSKVPITGGLAGDAGRFNRTIVGLNNTLSQRMVIAIGLHGEAIRTAYGSKDGWDVFGPIRTITQSEENTLMELDHTNALDLYKKYLGDRAQELPGAALLFPLHITFPDGTKVVRTILSINEEEKTMTFAGTVPIGAKAQFMMANFDRVIQGAANAANQAKMDIAAQLTLMVSCVGRKLVMKNRTDEELEAVIDTLGNSTYFGFYSNGEICPTPEGHSTLHNQTMTITTLSEV
jgi:hypothetical protein